MSAKKLFNCYNEISGFLGNLNEITIFCEIVQISNPVGTSDDLSVSIFKHLYGFSVFFQVDGLDGGFPQCAGTISGPITINGPSIKIGFSKNFLFCPAFDNMWGYIESDLHNWSPLVELLLIMINNIIMGIGCQDIFLK